MRRLERDQLSYAIQIIWELYSLKWKYWEGCLTPAILFSTGLNAYMVGRPSINSIAFIQRGTIRKLRFTSTL